MGQHERQSWFGCACCPGNITRFVASVPYYMYATQGDDIYVNLYIQSDADIKTDHNQINLNQTTAYPWEGKMNMTITPEMEQQFALRMRVPSGIQDRQVENELYALTVYPTE